MTGTSGAPSSAGGQAPRSEVRPYILRLVLTLVCGVVLMASVAIWAWSNYGKRLQEAPPLPSGKPPLHRPAAEPR